MSNILIANLMNLTTLFLSSSVLDLKMFGSKIDTRFSITLYQNLTKISNFIRVVSSYPNCIIGSLALCLNICDLCQFECQKARE